MANNKPKDLKEVKAFIYNKLKEQYGDYVLSDSTEGSIVVDTDTEFQGCSDVWIQLHYFY